MTMPVPKGHSPVAKPDGDLTENEYGFILDSCLKDSNRLDPIVVAFIDRFIACKNIAQASADCNIHRTLGYKIRHRKDVANCIQRMIDKSNVKHGFDSSEIMERTKELVDFDPIELYNPDGSFKSNLHDIEPEARRCLKKIKVKNIYNQSTDMNGMKNRIIIGEVIEYEFYDKLKAVELVGKEKKLFVNTTRIEHDVTKDMATVLLASTKRAEKAIETIKVIEVIDGEQGSTD